MDKVVLSRVRRSLGLCAAWLLGLSLTAAGCGDPEAPPAPPVDGHGPIGAGISAPLGEPLPGATAEQLETFEQGKRVAMRRFDRRDGLGPAFNVTFCGSCHERPTLGGSAGLYRNFFIGATVDDEGAFFPAESQGPAGGVLRLYSYAEGLSARPAVAPEVNVVAQRNPIPFFGVGLLASLPESEILSRADPDDLDGDGISGRPNFDRGFVGRFGRKSQTVSIEKFIRGPLFNHLGVTTEPLTDAQRAALPVDSSLQGALTQALRLHEAGQAAAPDGPLTDDDGVDDPEMSTDDLFKLVSFSMLLAAPEVEPLNDQRRRGLEVFDALGCGKCHTPRLKGPAGPLPVYSDLLIHDMGAGLADGLRAGEATGREFRTQPLWGISAVGPYLHDGRASTIEAAILWHGGEGQASRDAFEALDGEARGDLIEFLFSLGGREQRSEGLLPPGAAVPGVGEYGGPARDLSAAELDRFVKGRALFDRDIGIEEGLGGPRFNGDSCRACHFDPVLGGSGPRDVNVMRHGIINDGGQFVPPSVGTILHRLTILGESPNRPQGDAVVFEHRQTPHLFGLGLIEGIPEAAIVAGADPDDLDGDGISGRVSRTDGGRLGRFGWKAQVPTVAEFVRDALTAELGLTLPIQRNLTFGRVHDNDGVSDPELPVVDAALLADFLTALAGPPRQTPEDPAMAEAGALIFEEVQCAACHRPSFEGATGPVPLYSDLLLHEVLPREALGIEDTSADMWEFRTAPLWGLSKTAPYMHSGEADTIDEAIRLHAGEASESLRAYEALDAEAREALIHFLETL